MGPNLANISNTALMATQAIATLAGGASQNAAYRSEARSIREQSAIAQQENAAVVAQKQREVNSFAAAQQWAYASSGVTLQGSPLLVVDETRRLGQEEVAAIKRQGEAQARLARAKAAQAQNAGRAGLLSALFNTASNTATQTLARKRATNFPLYQAKTAVAQQNAANSANWLPLTPVVGTP